MRKKLVAFGVLFTFLASCFGIFMQTPAVASAFTYRAAAKGVTAAIGTADTASKVVNITDSTTASIAEHGKTNQGRSRTDRILIKYKDLGTETVNLESATATSEAIAAVETDTAKGASSAAASDTAVAAGAIQALPASLSAAKGSADSDKIIRRLIHIKSAKKLFSLTEHQKSRAPQNNRIFSESSASTASSSWYEAELSPGTTVDEAIAEALKDPEVQAAEPDYICHADSVGVPDASTDPGISQQWQLGACGIQEGWNVLSGRGIPGGSKNVTVAVIDTGINIAHEDLKNKLWINPREIPGNGIDDDHNGYIDDVNGYCVVTGQKSSNVSDDNGHGTHVAGIIAAEANNGVGGAGVAYGVRIMPIKAGDANGDFSVLDIVEAIQYAVNNGADVINMSFGGPDNSKMEHDALLNALSSCVLVASAGNSGKANDPTMVFNGLVGAPNFPAAYPFVLGVMAEQQNPAGNGDNLASYSNWDSNPNDGYEYSLMAPGDRILSDYIPGNSYGVLSGTSMAAPVVSAMAALARSVYSDRGLYSPAFIQAQLFSTGVTKQGITYSAQNSPIFYNEPNLYHVLTMAPQSKVQLQGVDILDDASKNVLSGTVGITNGGRLLQLGVTLRNIGSKINNLQVSVTAVLDNGSPDPYVTILPAYSDVSYGDVDSLLYTDNDIDRTNGTITGIEKPYKIELSDRLPANYTVKLQVSLSGTNAYTNESLHSSLYASFQVKNERGDLNGDGYTDVQDYSLLKSLLLQNGSSKVSTSLQQNGDMDHDGLLTSRDYGLLLKYIKK